jgi:hypothetical protein
VLAVNPIDPNALFGRRLIYFITTQVAGWQHSSRIFAFDMNGLCGQRPSAEDVPRLHFSLNYFSLILIGRSGPAFRRHSYEAVEAAGTQGCVKNWSERPASALYSTR